MRHDNLRELDSFESVLSLSGLSGLEGLGGSELVMTSSAKLVVNKNIYDTSIPPYPDGEAPPAVAAAQAALQRGRRSMFLGDRASCFLMDRLNARSVLHCVGDNAHGTLISNISHPSLTYNYNLSLPLTNSNSTTSTAPSWSVLPMPMVVETPMTPSFVDMQYTVVEAWPFANRFCVHLRNMSFGALPESDSLFCR